MPFSIYQTPVSLKYIEALSKADLQSVLVYACELSTSVNYNPFLPLVLASKPITADRFQPGDVDTIDWMNIEWGRVGYSTDFAGLVIRACSFYFPARVSSIIINKKRGVSYYMYAAALLVGGEEQRLLTGVTKLLSHETNAWSDSDPHTSTLSPCTVYVRSRHNVQTAFDLRSCTPADVATSIKHFIEI